MTLINWWSRHFFNLYVSINDNLWTELRGDDGRPLSTQSEEGWHCADSAPRLLHLWSAVWTHQVTKTLRLPGNLGVSLPLQLLTCNDTPQMAICCIFCTFVGCHTWIKQDTPTETEWNISFPSPHSGVDSPCMLIHIPDGKEKEMPKAGSKHKEQAGAKEVGL